MSGPFEGKVGTIAAVEGDLATFAVDVFARNTPARAPRRPRRSLGTERGMLLPVVEALT
jgi:hypothetical protein